MDNSLAAQNIVKLLPIDAVVAKWGEEIFFDLKAALPAAENLTHQVKVGDVAFCPKGNFLCVFLGPTPASVMEDPVPENPVVVIGRVAALPDRSRTIKPGEKVKVSLAEKIFPAPEKNDCNSTRKLSQAEIDVLVKQLLAEKKTA